MSRKLLQRSESQLFSWFGRPYAGFHLPSPHMLIEASTLILGDVARLLRCLAAAFVGGFTQSCIPAPGGDESPWQAAFVYAALASTLGRQDLRTRSILTRAWR